MKKLNLFFVLAAIVVIGIACSSQKEVSSSVTEVPIETDYTSDTTVKNNSIKQTTEVNETPEPQIHIVQKGENLWVIARKYGVTVKALAEANNIENTSLIKINQKLMIPERNEKNLKYPN